MASSDTMGGATKCTNHQYEFLKRQYSGGGSGLTKWTYSNFGPEIDFCAPSVYIKTADSGHYSAYREGTSYAAALISGMAARLFEEFPETNGDAIKQKLQNLTPGSQTDWLCGAGIPSFKGGR
ncbi:S8 family serine peptidase [Tumebacillus sp. BK434]|uniref:S8 family serine peptidase n=1 Tax=Tumebacillus sp. BK434 TaxID=2512169 RepID=UPI00104E0B4F|nr:S8 family serine peptidase [Tumebacillus sp. BK434]